MPRKKKKNHWRKGIICKSEISEEIAGALEEVGPPSGEHKSRLRVYYLMLSGLNMSAVAKEMGISRQAVRKLIDKMLSENAENGTK